MAGITLQQAQEALAYWLEADRKLAQGIVLRVGDRELRRAETLEQIRYWDGQVKALDAQAAGASPGPLGRIRYAVPRA